MDEKNTIFFLAFLAVLIVLLCSLIFIFRPYPVDDFLRHVRYGDYEAYGGYAMMFPHSYFEQLSFNPWAGYDSALSLCRSLFKENTILILQMLFASLFFAAIMTNLLADAKEEMSELQPLLIIAAFALMSYAMLRITLIRPCILIGILFLFALKGRGFIAGVLFSLFGAFFYHLFFIYSGSLAVGHYFKGCKRFSYGLIVGMAAGLAGWAFYTSWDYFPFLYKLVFSLSDRGGMEVGENVFSLVLLKKAFVFFTALLFFTTLLRTKTVDMYIVLLLATIPLALQSRYFADLSLPLLVLYIVKNNMDIKVFYSKNKKVFEVFALIAVFLVVPALQERSVASPATKDIRGIEIPHGAVVFTDGLPLNFAVIFHNSDVIRVIPSAEIGFNDKRTKEVIKQAMNEQALTDSFCEYAKEKGIQYALTAHKATGKCLRQIQSFRSGSSRYDLYGVEP